MNYMTEDKTYTVFTLKSGSKDKSIHSYINKICFLMTNMKTIEIKACGIFILKLFGNNINKIITILEILKRKLKELNYKIEICYDNITKEEKLIKIECMKVSLKIDEEFLKNNFDNLQSNY